MILTTYLVTPGLKTAALPGALLVFHPGSGATVALTDTLLQVFSALQRGDTDAVLLGQISANHNSGSPDDLLDNCLRLLRQQQLISVSETATASGSS